MEIATSARRHVRPIHPFPARMAPEIALEGIADMPLGSTVLDPMVGSGTVVRSVAEYGHRALGFDTDPLAVLMARVWTTPLAPQALRVAVAEVVAHAARLPVPTRLDWIDNDPETAAFVDFWFAAPQQVDLRRIASTLATWTGSSEIGDALRVALSRIIITKDRGASLASDVSHSRPHRTRSTNDFNVLTEFERSAYQVAQRIEQEPPPDGVSVMKGDARSLTTVSASTIDAIITSPPYLNALDYIRGHRLALVWLGHQLKPLRRIRTDNIGTERSPDPTHDVALAAGLCAAMGLADGLPSRERRMVDRYVLDLAAVARETARVLRPGGRAIFVVGNSSIRGVFVHNARAVSSAITQAGLLLVSDVERDLPEQHRYLPPPRSTPSTNVERRMRTEAVLTFQQP